MAVAFAGDDRNCWISETDRVTIESPAMLDLTEAEQRYFDEGGEL